ncbi:MAG: hypothetical protein LC650_05290 [Actinobacteria bacterium]|nr:hypothetical protein [Actinomycetota bacterium]
MYSETNATQRAKTMVREYTNKLIDAMDDSIISAQMVADMALKYMSEDEVKDMCLANDILLDDLEEDYELPEDAWDDETLFVIYGDFGLEDQTLLYETTLYSEAEQFFNGYTGSEDMGGYLTVELGYVDEDGEWVSQRTAEKDLNW